jgi:hypothetical protein
MYTVMADAYLAHCINMTDTAEEICSHGIAVAHHAGLNQPEARLALLLAKTYELQGEKKKAMDLCKRYASKPSVAQDQKLKHIFALRMLRMADSETQVKDEIVLLEQAKIPQVHAFSQVMRALRFMRGGEYKIAYDIVVQINVEQIIQNCYTGVLYYMTLLQCHIVLGTEGGRLINQAYQMTDYMVKQLAEIQTRTGRLGPPYILSVDATGANDIAMEWNDLSYALASAYLVLLAAAVYLGHDDAMQGYYRAVEQMAGQSLASAPNREPLKVVILARLLWAVCGVSKGDLALAGSCVQQTKRTTAQRLRAFRRYVCGLIFQIEGDLTNAVNSFEKVDRGGSVTSDDLAALSRVQAMILRGPDAYDETLVQRLAASPSKRICYFGELVQLAYNELRQPAELTRRQASVLLTHSAKSVGPQLTALTLYCALRFGLGTQDRLRFSKHAYDLSSKFYSPDLQRLLFAIYNNELAACGGQAAVVAAPPPLP